MKWIEILMVEDNRGDIVLIQEAMARAGLTHRVNVVPDGMEAMDYLRRQGKYAEAARPDLIVLDLKLPRKSGLEVLDAIRPDPALAGIPIMILSSSTTDLEIARRRGRPGENCFAKPSTFAGYVELVQTMEAFGRGADEGRN